jgi:hypothetical protein
MIVDILCMLTLESNLPIIRIMKTTVDIPDKLLKSAMQQSGSKTIRGAVLAALEWYNHRARQREVIKMLGTFKDFMTQDELREMRQSREQRHDDRRQQLMDRGASGAGRPSGPGARRKSA